MTQLDLFPPSPQLTRSQAIEILTPYLTQNLRPLAAQYNIVNAEGIPHHKGWAGLLIEALLGKKADNQQAPDFGDWELKVLPLEIKPHPNRPQEAMINLKSRLAITMFQVKELYENTFIQSHLFQKTKHMLLALRLYYDKEELYSPLYALAYYDLLSPLQEQIEEEYNQLVWLVRQRGVMGLKDFKGQYLAIQNSTKDTHLWTFYAQKKWVSYMIQQQLILSESTK